MLHHTAPRCRYELISDGLWALSGRYAAQELTAEQYSAEYVAWVKACGWTYSEFIAEIDRQWNLGEPTFPVVYPSA
jgi:hypothetical protein